MDTSPPHLAPPHMPPPYQVHKDNEHLKILSIFYYINAGLSALGIVGVILHGMMMLFMLTNEQFIEHTDEPHAAEVMQSMSSAFIIFYACFTVLLIANTVINILAARYLSQKKNMGFCQVVAGINCINIPLGTALGIFTFVVLSRYSIKLAYQENCTSYTP